MSKIVIPSKHHSHGRSTFLLRKFCNEKQGGGYRRSIAEILPYKSITKKRRSFCDYIVNSIRQNFRSCFSYTLELGFHCKTFAIERMASEIAMIRRHHNLGSIAKLVLLSSQTRPQSRALLHTSHPKPRHGAEPAPPAPPTCCPAPSARDPPRRELSSRPQTRPEWERSRRAAPVLFAP